MSVALVFLLCSCKDGISDVIESLISDTVPQSVNATDSNENSEYRELFAAYKASNDEYYKKTEAAINTIIGQKYGYGITAYNHSDELSEIAEMFFDSNSAAMLDMYFTIRGYDDRVYETDGNKATFTCSKKDDVCVYKMTYDADSRFFEISYYVNDELKDSLSCEMTDKELVKCCYVGTLERTFISRVNSDGESQVEWFDRCITSPYETSAGEDRGNVEFDGEKLSGVIK